MAIIPDKNGIGIELQELLRERGMKQVDLARHLGLTPAAVSQFFHGKTLPSALQFERILEFLRPSTDKVNDLVKIFSIARQGGTLVQSDFNRNLFALRCSVGISLERLTELSGIAGHRLCELEKSPEAAPDSGELEKLSRILKCQPIQLLGATPVQTPESPFMEAAENFAPLEGRLPLLTLHDLAFYKATDDFAIFATSRANSYLKHTVLPGALAILTAPASKLKLHPQAQVTLVLGNPERKRRGGLFIGRGRRGGYVLWEQLQRNVWQPLSGLSSFNRVNTAIWRLPVLEMIFLPDSTSGKE